MSGARVSDRHVCLVMTVAADCSVTTCCCPELLARLGASKAGADGQASCLRLGCSLALCLLQALSMPGACRTPC